jgi:DNA-binding CsgD family transcriptional regulator
VTEGYAAAAPSLQRALTAFHSEQIGGEHELVWLWVAARMALALWDDESWDVLSSRLVEHARPAGAMAALPMALTTRAIFMMFAGDMRTAAALCEEIEVITEATRQPLPPYAAVTLAALRGDEVGVAAVIEGSPFEPLARAGEPSFPAADTGRAVLYNGLGRFEEALAVTAHAGDHRLDLGVAGWLLAERVEAAARCGETALAEQALERLCEMTQASGTPWGLGIEARSRALLSHGRAAERLYQEAITRLEDTRIPLAIARAHLLYGEWLRHEGRRTGAREQLHTAQEHFIAMGAEAFAQRAARELEAAGETAGPHVADHGGGLTAQEALVAYLARDGLANADIGARLFISPRTVEYHLHKVFVKLRISSRTELDRALPDNADAVRAASPRRPDGRHPTPARRPTAHDPAARGAVRPSA